MPLPVIAVTGGEPAGIGADICLDLADAKLSCRPVVLADIGLLRQRAAQLGKTVALRDFSPNLPPQPGTLDVWHIPLAAPCEAGRLNAANSPYVLQLLDTAHQGIQNGTFAAMTTAPCTRASSTTRARAADFSAATPNIWPKKAVRPASS